MSEPAKVARAVKKAAKSAVARATETALASVPRTAPALKEPTKPGVPLPPKPDQAGPDRRTATGAATDATAAAARDSKAGGPAGTPLDPRIVLRLLESFRRAKAIGAWGAGADALTAAGIDPRGTGVAVGESPDEVLGELQTLLGAHRVWDRLDPALS